MKGLVIAAPSSGQGKTVITLALLRALVRRGVDVTSAKAGPDYIDPAFHAAATGRPSLTLDGFAMPPDQLRARAAMQPADLLVVEGAMGLLDGAATGGRIGRGATAEVAAALELPVICVIDAARIGQTAGALVAGLAAWSPVPLAGVILNRVASPRHEAMLRPAIEETCPVLGVVARSERLSLPARHLGLVQAGETSGLDEFIEGAAQEFAGQCDLSRLIAAARPVVPGATPRPIEPLGQRIAIARDEAFSFTYWHQLADWRAAGAELSFFSPLADQAPEPTADAVFLPGGYPEIHGGKLASADEFRRGMAEARARGTLIIGECGGYMVLGQGLVDAKGHRHAMLGMLGVETSFAERRLHLGYRRVRGLGPIKGSFVAHEFHYATVLSESGNPLFDAQDATGAQLPPMGLSEGRVCGSFAHLIETV
ncbi:MAG: cobyrinate a,c-diamide synthase [Pseudomonadota bacterium]